MTTTNDPLNGGPQRKKPKSTRLALTIAIVVTAIWSLIHTVSGFSKPHAMAGTATTAASRFAYDFGTVIGGSLFLSLIVWLVLYFGFVKRQDPERGGRHFLILIGTSVVFGLAPLMLALTMFLSMPGPSVVAEQIAQEIQAEAAVEQARLEQERDQIVGAGIINPARIGRQGGIQDARDRLNQLRSLFEEAMSGSEAKAQALRARLVNEETNERRRTAALKAFDEELARARAPRDKLITLMNAICDELEAQIDILANSRGFWVVQDGQIGFYQPRDSAAFNFHANRLIELANEVETLRAAVHADAPSRRNDAKGE